MNYRGEAPSHVQSDLVGTDAVGMGTNPLSSAGWHCCQPAPESDQDKLRRVQVIFLPKYYRR